MKKILIILSGVLLVMADPFAVSAKGVFLPTIAKKISSSKNIKAKKKKYKSVKSSNKKAYKNVKKTSQKKKKVKSAKKKVVKKKATKKTKYNYRYNVGEIQSYIHQKIYEYGWTENDYYAILQIVNRESSFNPYAVNKKSGSCGLFQAYPCSKMAKYGKDYRTNYKVQVKFGFEYIKTRYQTPQQAWNFWQSHHWY